MFAKLWYWGGKSNHSQRHENLLFIFISNCQINKHGQWTKSGVILQYLLSAFFLSIIGKIFACVSYTPFKVKSTLLDRNWIQLIWLEDEPYKAQGMSLCHYSLKVRSDWHTLGACALFFILTSDARIKNGCNTHLKMGLVHLIWRKWETHVPSAC